MIYLIDDKEKRQKEFGWNDSIFNKFSDILQPIYSLNDLESERLNIFQQGNIVLYHESFLDNTSIKKKAQEKREDLEDFARKHTNFHLAIYSGSKSSRWLDQNIAYLPVSTVFQNLGVFSDQVKKGDVSLKYLLFGQDPDVEEKLLRKLKEANDKEIENNPAYIPNAKNLFIRPSRENIQEPIQDSTVFKIHKNVSDKELSEKVTQWLSEEKFDNIFIPICFGPTLSDFNGLRLAAHIRCTETPNQLKNIFIYSFVGFEYLFENDYFNILKTNNVQLIGHAKEAFEKAGNQSLDPLKSEDLPKEIAKLRLDPPNNYEGKHSIANEWAIYQWSKVIGAEKNEEISQVFENVKTNLYFKYLRTIYPVLDTNIAKEELKIDHSDEPSVLLIDDESEKGWYEVFSQILGDLNDIYTDYIGENFKGLTPEGIISQSTQKISDDDINVVILDLRLSDQDFNPEISIEQLTGHRILKEIKKLNKGIQVIITTASNKFWNYESTIQLGADGYIIKRGDSDVSQDVKNFKNIVERSIIKASILKPVFKKIDEIINIENKKQWKKDFEETLQPNLLIAFKLLEESFADEKYRNFAFLQLFQIVESFSDRNRSFNWHKKEVNGTKCIEKMDDNRFKWKLKYYEKNEADKGYPIFTREENVISREIPVQTFAKVSFLIAFYKNGDDNCLDTWGYLNDVRNKTVHNSEVGLVENDDILKMLKFLKYLLDENEKECYEQIITNSKLKQLKYTFGS